MLEYNGKIVYCVDVIDNVHTDYAQGFDDFEENIDYYTDYNYSTDILFYEYCKNTEEAEKLIWLYFNEAPEVADRLKKTEEGYILT